jgi:RHS repeat-associated protein
MAPEGFTFEPQPETTLGGGTDYTPYFVPDPGVTDQLTVPAVTLEKWDDGTYWVMSDAGLDPYNPADPVFSGNGQYTLTALDGTTWAVGAASGLVSTEQDRNGNTLTYTDTTITSSTGRQVVLGTDGAGRITTITDPNNNTIQFQYSTAGDLLSVTDRDNHTTHLQYTVNPSGASTHDLSAAFDPTGVQALQVNYGPDGRATSKTDAANDTTSLGYTVSPTALQGTVTVPGASTPSALTFDTQGDVTAAQDPLGNSVSAGYTGTDLTSQTVTVNSQQLTTTMGYDGNHDPTSVTNPLGETSQVTYNAYGQLLTASDARGATTLSTYDANGNLLSTKTPTGQTTSATYDAHGNRLTETTADGTSTYHYDQYGVVSSETDPQGATTTFTVDADGNQTGSTWTWVNPNNPNDRRTVAETNTLDKEGRVTGTTTTTPEGTTSTSTTYDAAGRVVQTTDQLNNTTVTVYDPAGRVIQTQSPDGTVTDTVYDAQGRAQYTDSPHPAGQATDGTETFYDADGRVVATERLADVVIVLVGPTGGAQSSVLQSAGAVLSITQTVYDAAGRAVWSDDPHAPGQPTGGTNTVYDAAGRVTGTNRYHNVVITLNNPTTNPSTVLTSPGTLYSTTSSTYDAAGQVLSTTDALGHTSQFTYDDAGRLLKTTFADGSTTSDAYDANGRKAAQIDQNGLETDYQYDANGNLTAVVLPAVTNPANGQSVRPTFQYTYDVYRNLTSVQDPLQHKTAYQYDEFGQKVSETLPMGQAETWAYNAPGQLTTATDFDGNQAKYQYDALGRVQRKDLYLASNLTAPSETDTYTYQNWDGNGDGGYTNTVTGPGGTTTSQYDVHGNLVSVASPQGTINYSYDLATGRETEVSTANTDIQYAYDQEGRLSTVTTTKLDGATLGTPLVTTYGYDLNNNLVSTSLPNGTSETRTYDVLNRLVSLTNTGPSGVISGYTYAMDPVGHRTAVQENTGRRVEYTYDNLYRLVQEAITDPVSGNRTLTYSYDLANNRVASTDSGAPAGQQSLTYVYDPNDRLTSVTGTGSPPSYSASYAYDAAGNTLTVSGTGVDAATYTWDAAGRLVGATITNHVTQAQTSVSLTYDDAGNKVSETVNGTTTTYLNDANQAYDQVLEEYAPAGVLAATYVRGLDLLFQDRGAARTFYLRDGSESTRALTNTSGAVTDLYTYDAYGRLLAQTGTTVNPYLFTGEQFDPALQEYNLRARYYDPSSGLFMGMDPSSGSIIDPTTLHPFLFAAGDPVNLIDPSGRAWEWNDKNGGAAHFLFSVYALIMGKTPTFDFRLSTVANVLGNPMFKKNKEGATLKPDAVDFNDKTYFELKPVTHKTNATLRAEDVAQLQSYAVGLKSHGFTAGDQAELAQGKTPIGMLKASDGKWYILVLQPAAREDKDLKGLIYYYTRKPPGNMPQFTPAPVPSFALKPNLAMEMANKNLKLFDPLTQQTVQQQMVFDDNSGWSVENVVDAITWGLFAAMEIGVFVAIGLSVSIASSNARAGVD